MYGAESLANLYQRVLPGRIRFRPITVDECSGVDDEPPVHRKLMQRAVLERPGKAQRRDQYAVVVGQQRFLKSTAPRARRRARLAP